LSVRRYLAIIRIFSIYQTENKNTRGIGFRLVQSFDAAQHF